MKDSILKALYRGTLAPWDVRTVWGAADIGAVKERSDAEDQLARPLPPELKPALERLREAQESMDCYVAETGYVDGFKTGARVMLEILAGAGEITGE